MNTEPEIPFSKALHPNTIDCVGTFFAMLLFMGAYVLYGLYNIICTCISCYKMATLCRSNNVFVDFWKAMYSSDAVVGLAIAVSCFLLSVIWYSIARGIDNLNCEVRALSAEICNKGIVILAPKLRPVSIVLAIVIVLIVVGGGWCAWAVPTSLRASIIGYTVASAALIYALREYYNYSTYLQYLFANYRQFSVEVK